MSAEGLSPAWEPDAPHERPPVEAAVLIGVVERGASRSVIYTERSAELRSHSGQISFPGGRIEPEDGGAATAALREASEEVGLDPGEARVLGYLPPYLSGTNYLITPVVAAVRPTRPFVANPAEVRSVFEVPLGWLADEQSYGLHRFQRGTVEHETWELLHGDLRIWGITAFLTRQFRDLALVGEEPW